jgi:hypothetical protein
VSGETAPSSVVICYLGQVVATSIRISVGLQVYQIESYFSVGGGNAGGGNAGLPVNEARALLRRIDDGRNSRRLRAFVRSLCRSTLEWDDEPHVLDDLLRTGRLRVRAIEALVFRAEPVEAPPAEFKPVENEIVEAHTVEIDLVDADGNPVPGEPYRITLPDGTERTGRLDDQGKARIAGIEQGGTCKVCFYKRDAEAWAPA